jgi:hypothetical protein
MEGGLAERLLGEGTDVARGIQCSRQAIHQPPLVAVHGTTRRRHWNRPAPRRRLGFGWPRATPSPSLVCSTGFRNGDRPRARFRQARVFIARRGRLEKEEGCIAGWRPGKERKAEDWKLVEVGRDGPCEWARFVAGLDLPVRLSVGTAFEFSNGNSWPRLVLRRYWSGSGMLGRWW